VICLHLDSSSHPGLVSFPGLVSSLHVHRLSVPCYRAMEYRPYSALKIKYASLCTCRFRYAYSWAFWCFIEALSVFQSLRVRMCVRVCDRGRDAHDGRAQFSRIEEQLLCFAGLNLIQSPRRTTIYCPHSLSSRRYRAARFGRSPTDTHCIYLMLTTFVQSLTRLHSLRTPSAMPWNSCSLTGQEPAWIPAGKPQDRPQDRPQDQPQDQPYGLVICIPPAHSKGSIGQHTRNATKQSTSNYT